MQTYERARRSSLALFLSDAFQDDVEFCGFEYSDPVEKIFAHVVGQQVEDLFGKAVKQMRRCVLDNDVDMLRLLPAVIEQFR